LGLAALAGIVAFAAITGGGQQARRGPAIGETFDALAASIGFAIAQVEISGHTHTPESSIHDTLDLGNVRSLLRLDSAAVRERIERLPWIQTATVTRVFPDRLSISVTERTPSARWRRDDRIFLVDATGRVLTQIQPGSVPHLPLVSGEGAAEHAAAILAMIERYPAIAQRMEMAERIDGRRWTLRLEGGPAIQLPAEGEAAALERLAAAGVMQGLSAMSASTVDVRVSDRMAVRRGEPRVPAPVAVHPLPATEKPPAPAAVKEKHGAQRG
jgi:cell division protein FtsQ